MIKDKDEDTVTLRRKTYINIVNHIQELHEQREDLKAEIERLTERLNVQLANKKSVGSRPVDKKEPVYEHSDNCKCWDCTMGP